MCVSQVLTQDNFICKAFQEGTRNTVHLTILLWGTDLDMLAVKGVIISNKF